MDASDLFVLYVCMYVLGQVLNIIPHLEALAVGHSGTKEVKGLSSSLPALPCPKTNDDEDFVMYSMYMKIMLFIHK